MDFLVEDKQIFYLYQLKDGRCLESFANLIALTSGIPVHVTDRSAVVSLFVLTRVCTLKTKYFP